MEPFVAQATALHDHIFAGLPSGMGNAAGGYRPGPVLYAHRSVRPGSTDGSGDADVRWAQFTTALDSRIVIEQAKGILSVRQRVTLEQAVSSLRHYARSHRVLLSGVAHGVVRQGLVPPPAPVQRVRPGRTEPFGMPCLVSSCRRRRLTCCVDPGSGRRCHQRRRVWLGGSPWTVR
ncbi:ANTAR domain-containing protein [Streptomyces sp. NPDC060205]|uniref:ANTAR domain-containing protein n=1 Tax=Streptomyces sp. NPDC060205 TaxID=3347072 RepID=UPI00365DC94B